MTPYVTLSNGAFLVGALGMLVVFGGKIGNFISGTQAKWVGGISVCFIIAAAIFETIGV